MQHIKISCTDDISAEKINYFIDSLNKNNIFAHPGERLVLCSNTPPSWITFIIESEWWVQAFGAYAAIYIAEIFKEAGKDTWKNRVKILNLISIGPNNLFNFISNIIKFKKSLDKNTECVIALKTGGSEFYDKSGVMLTFNDINLAIAEFSLITHHIPNLLSLLTEKNIADKAVNGIHMRLLDDGSLHLFWLERDSDNFRKNEEILPLEVSQISPD